MIFPLPIIEEGRGQIREASSEWLRVVDLDCLAYLESKTDVRTMLEKA